MTQFSWRRFLFSCYFGILALIWWDPLELRVPPAIHDANVAYNSLIFTRDGRLIGEIYSTDRRFASIDEIPKSLIDAVIAVEDRRFYHHFGVDVLGICRAIIQGLWHREIPRGTSTITQQTARMLFLTPDNTLYRKLQEAMIAIRMEIHMSKKEILELYLNLPYLGARSYGVASASLKIFGKPVSKLAPHESALMAGLFQGPSLYDPLRFPDRAKRRQALVIQSMVRAGMIHQHEARNLKSLPLNYGSGRDYKPLIAPYFRDYVRREGQRILGRDLAGLGLNIYTTLDLKTQLLAENSMKGIEGRFKRLDGLSSMRGGGPYEGALLTTNPHTGEILAMIGGRDYRTSKFNRAVDAKRQPGSAFKPIVYSLALKRGQSWIDKLPLWPIDVKGYRPRNGVWEQGNTTLLRAFYQSMNTVTVALGTTLGLGSIQSHGKSLGIDSPIVPKLSSLLGGAELTPLELATVYGVFANQGVRHDLFGIQRMTSHDGETVYKKHPEGQQVLEPDVAFMMKEGMKMVLSQGTARAAKNLSWMASGKTGTSDRARDNWFCGFGGQRLTVVWAGVERGKTRLTRLSGASLALPVWKDLMEKIMVPEAGPMAIPSNLGADFVNENTGFLDPRGVLAFYRQGYGPQSFAPLRLRTTDEVRYLRP